MSAVNELMNTQDQTQDHTEDHARMYTQDHTRIHWTRYAYARPAHVCTRPDTYTQDHTRVHWTRHAYARPDTQTQDQITTGNIPLACNYACYMCSMKMLLAVEVS